VIELLLVAENALALGLLDQAERTYRQVLAADPRNAIAAVGLSRVALERGDEPAAIALAHDALAIDPENSTARRMIDRLEEVTRFRGAAAARPAGALVPALVPAPALAPAPALVPAPEPAAVLEPAAVPEPAAYAADAAEQPPHLLDHPGPAPARPGLLRRLLRRS
jgi:tetratricopeptide (TPR) repeat protein